MICDEAITWEGVRFHHQESNKVAGCDCKGLVYGVSKVFGLDKAAGYDRDFKNYKRSVDGRQMRSLLKKYMILKRKHEAKPADVLWLSFLMFPQHLGILLPNNQLIHASEPDGKVIRHDISKEWWSRVCGVYQFKGIADG